MAIVLRFIEKLITRGQERGEIRAEIVSATFAPLIIGMIEGGWLFARLYDEPGCAHRAVDQVIHVLNTELRIPV
ncbi:MAG: TetR family transcriptional regulator C-terminal domain-containing protein [Ktedonobacterales bacterium]